MKKNSKTILKLHCCKKFWKKYLQNFAGILKYVNTIKEYFVQNAKLADRKKNTINSLMPGLKTIKIYNFNEVNLWNYSFRSFILTLINLHIIFIYSQNIYIDYFGKPLL